MSQPRDTILSHCLAYPNFSLAPARRAESTYGGTQGLANFVIRRTGRHPCKIIASTHDNVVLQTRSSGRLRLASMKRGQSQNQLRQHGAAAIQLTFWLTSCKWPHPLCPMMRAFQSLDGTAQCFQLILRMLVSAMYTSLYSGRPDEATVWTSCWTRQTMAVTDQPFSVCTSCASYCCAGLCDLFDGRGVQLQEGKYIPNLCMHRAWLTREALKKRSLRSLRTNSQPVIDLID